MSITNTITELQSDRDLLCDLANELECLLDALKGATNGVGQSLTIDSGLAAGDQTLALFELITGELDTVSAKLMGLAYDLGSLNEDEDSEDD